MIRLLPCIAATCCAFALVLLVSRPATAGGQSAAAQVEFTNSGAASAQAPFLRGVALLHSFAYDDARDAFREAQRADAGFAMAYWGEAMTYAQPMAGVAQREAALEVMGRLAPTPAGRAAKAGSPVEKDWVASLDVIFGAASDGRPLPAAFASAMARLHQKYPGDDEVSTFFALSLLASSNDGRDVALRMRAAALLEGVRERRPLHPGAAHYLIRAYDDPVHAPLGLRVADAYVRMVPSDADGQHLASHIYAGLGLWDEAASANERAVRATDASAVRRNQANGGRNLRALLWLEYSYLQQGRYSDAKAVLTQLDAAAASGSATDAGTYQALGRGAWLVESRRWADARSAVESPGLQAAAAAADAFAIGLAAIRAGDRGGAQEALQRIASQAEDVAPLSAARRSNGLAPVSPSTAIGPDRRAASVMAQQLEAALLFGEGRREEGLVLARQASVVEDAMPGAAGPPSPVKPAHELVGEMLLDLRRPREAMGEFEQTLARFPRRALSLLGLGRAATSARDRETAKRAYDELALVWHGADKALPELKELSTPSLSSPGAWSH